MTPNRIGKIKLATTSPLDQQVQAPVSDDGAAISESSHLSSAIRMARMAFSSSANTAFG